MGFIFLYRVCAKAGSVAKNEWGPKKPGQAEHRRIAPFGVPSPRITSDEAGVILSNGNRLVFRLREMQWVIDALVMRMILGGDILNVITSSLANIA
jgi:hypothetical protein